MKDLLERHLLQHLGPPTEVYRRDAQGAPLTIEIRRYADRPRPRAVTYLTFGLHEAVLPVKHGQMIRQELVFSHWDHNLGLDGPALLHGVAVELRRRGQALLQGQALMQATWPGYRVDALYVTPPPYFPESFDLCAATVPPTMLVGLVPIDASERDFLGQQGWRRFEDLWAERNPNLLDLGRPSTIAS